MKIKLQDKILGYYIALGLFALELLTTIVYICCFATQSTMSWWTFAFLLVGVIAGVVLFALDKFDYYPIVAFVTTLVALLTFIVSQFNYLVDYVVAIDVTSISASFVISIILLLLTLLASIVILCMEQRK
jgi:hypothetical protein